MALAGATTAGWKNQGEGWGFSLVIADSLASATAATVDGLYNLATRNTNTNNYCLAFNAISTDAAYVAGDVGTLNDGGIENDVGTADCLVVATATTPAPEPATVTPTPAPAPPPASSGSLASPAAFLAAILAVIALS